MSEVDPNSRRDGTPLESPLRRDWGLFVLMLLFHQALVGLVYGLTLAWDLPVHLGYAIGWEQETFGAPVARLAQDWSNPGLLGGLIHASVYPVMLAIGYALWKRRREEVPRYQLSVGILLFGSLLAHLAAPTVPAHLAADLGVAEHVAHATAWDLPSVFADNPLGTVPSLPFALAVMVTAVGFRLFGRRGLALLVWLAAVGFVELHRGEAYVLSLVVAAVFALAVLALTGRRSMEPIRRRGAVGLALLALTAAAGIAGGQLARSWEPSLSFCERELVGRTPLAYRFIGERAFAQGDDALAVGAFERLSPELHDADSLRMMGRAHARMGHLGLADRALRAAERAAPDDPRPLYWRFRLVYEAGQISEEQLLGAVHALHNRYQSELAKELAQKLEALVR